MLIIEGERILLIPKVIVSYTTKYTAQQFHQHFVLEFLKHEHLRLNTALVLRKKLKNGTEKVYVTKKSIKEHEAPLDKEYLTSFTENHPEIFSEFRTKSINALPPISNEEISEYASKELFSDIVEHLIFKLRSINPGKEEATLYHRTVVGILELIFYPNLSSPQIEREIHSGRKRIDITFDIGASEGFFFNLSTLYRTPCQFIIIECKNYSRDVANPELDQISSRFSPNKGKFGLIVCRSIEDMDNFILRCSDTYKDDRGIVIPLVDDDLIYILNSLRSGEIRPEEELLRERFRDIALR